jgi:medium-chain acyl-[acyl-carrier-protein] hydrolase
VEYSRNYLVHYYELDAKRKLSLPSLIHYFEDLAMLNSEAEGLTLDYYDRNERGWMLFKWDIKIVRYPAFNEMITVITHPSAFKNFLANRKYKVIDMNGGLLAEAQSVWLFVNTKTRRPLRVPEDMYTKFDVNKESELIFDKLEDLPVLTLGKHSLRTKVQNSDIDTNQHVNNVRYIEWAMESLPKDFTDNHIASRIQVNYKKELNLGDEAEIVSDVNLIKEELISGHSIYNSGKDICNLELHWTKTF